MSGSIGQFAILLAYCAILFVLVRPGSNGPGFVENIGKGAASVIGAATGGGTF